jgi:hypothetical protein
MTIHTSKGLEATYVFVMGMNHEFPRFPNEQEIQRQRRTFYVGATRCKKYLTMTYSAEKNLKRSRYFEEISEDLFRAENNGGREENNRTPSPFPWVGREHRPRYAVTDLAKYATSAMLRKFREKGGILDLRWEKKSKLSHDSVGWKPNIKKRMMSQYGDGVELYIRYRGFGMTHEEAIEKVESYKGKRKARVKGYHKHIRRAKNFIARLKNEKFWCHDNGGEGAFDKTKTNAIFYKYTKKAKNERVLYSEYRFEYLGYKEQFALKAFPDFYLVGTKEIVDIKFRTAEMTAEYTIQLLLYVCALRAIGLPVERISLYNVKAGAYYTASVKNWHHEYALASALVGESIRKKMEGWEHLLENYFPGEE